MKVEGVGRVGLRFMWDRKVYEWGFGVQERVLGWGRAIVNID